MKLTLSYAGFLMIAGALLLAAVWVFLLRGVPASNFRPGFSDFLRVFDPSNFGPRIFVPAAVVALAFLLAFGLLGGWLLAGRMLAPLARITHATRIVANGSLSHRIELQGPRDELHELADSFDTMVSRLEHTIAEQRRFAANASHELRTPLATTKALLEVALKDPSGARTELIGRLHHVNARAIDLTEALLMLSRADQGAFARETLDLSLLMEESAETLLTLAERRGVALHSSSTVTPVVGSGALLLQMTTNLLHNAIVHNLPQHGKVWVETSLVPDAALLTVENSGPTIEPAAIPVLLEPFQRGAGRIRTGDSGVGLGLAIVRSIVRAHQGSLVLSARTCGGLRVAVRLPAALMH
ncbi:sensor histidine kinase [Allosphingosinicella deserti]|nr:HAMP domain-containing sensor histidine kinase [Sphingomonas deserti]